MLVGAPVIAANDARAQGLDADAVLNKMSAPEQTAYLAGVIEGLAYARFLRDSPSITGMQCIYDWFYDENIETGRRINAWLERHLDKPVGPLIYVLVKQECGE
jgi:hypothetical protein